MGRDAFELPFPMWYVLTSEALLTAIASNFNFIII